MSEKKINRLLLTNDDGIDAPGLALLESIAHQLADEVWIVAPATDQSGVSNAISLRAPLRVNQRAARKYAVHGTPADCVAFAVKNLMAETPPDVLLSGINCGSNIGFETVLSGTVGAAITGMLLGIPAIALSQDKEPEDAVDWQAAKVHGRQVLQQLLTCSWPKETCLNVNFPNLPADAIHGIKVTSQGRGKVKGIDVTPVNDPHGETWFWIRVEHGPLAVPADSELAAINAGYISVTPLTYERTDWQTRDALREQLGA